MKRLRAGIQIIIKVTITLASGKKQVISVTVQKTTVSEKWGVTPRQINYLCASGRIPGAVKMAGVWLIPKTAEKPVDGRTKQGKVQKA